MKNLTYAVVGAGFVSQFHFLALERMRANVKYICDINEQNAAPWCRRLHAAYTADFAVVCKDPEVDVVIVTSSTSSHSSIVMAAIQARKAVICEKSLGVSAKEAKEMVEAAREAGVILYTSYMKRYLPAVRKAKELFPLIGRPIDAAFQAHQCWDFPNDGPTPGGMIPKEGGSDLKRGMGGGILYCGGSHVVDMICNFFGRPDGVMAMLHYPRELDVETNAALLLRYPDTPVRMSTIMHPLSKIGAFRYGWDERFEIKGTRGSLEIVSAEWKDHEVNASFVRHYDQAAKSMTEYYFEPCSPFEMAERAFNGWIAAGEQGEQDSSTGFDVDAIIEAAIASDREGREIRIDWR